MRVSAPIATIWVIGITTVVRAILATQVGLGIGESYYAGAVRHLSLSYFDQPPATAFLAWLAVRVAGTTTDFVLRAPFVLLFAATTWLTFLLGRRLFGAWAGFWAALLFSVVPVFGVSTGIFFQPEGPMMFGWAATLYLLAPLMVGDTPVAKPHRQWLAVGVMLGLTLLSKYTGVFLVSGTALYLLLTPERRSWFRRPEPYLALIAAAACFAPVLIWNAQHGWISLRWQGARGVAFQGIHFDWMLKNLTGQMLEIQPWIWLALLIEPVRAWWTAPPDRSPRIFLACVGVPPILAFTAVSAYSNIGDHFHWAAAGYFTLLIGLGATIDRWLARRPVPALATVSAMVLATVTFVALLLVQAVTGRFSEGNNAAARWLTSGNDATIELIDFDALVPAFRARGLLDRPDLFLFSDHWYLGGKVDYAFKGRLPFLLFNATDPREYAFFDASSRWIGKEGILVSQRDSLAAVRREYDPYCAAIDSLGSVPIVRRTRVEWTLYLYRCQALIKPYPVPYH